jgi:hypothetical protein
MQLPSVDHNLIESTNSTELFDFFWTLSTIWYVEVLQKTTTFRRLDLSPSSGGWGRLELVSIIVQ